MLFLTPDAERGEDRSILEHLDQCGPCRRLVAEATRPDPDQGPSGSSGPPLPHRTLTVGQCLLDRYEVRRFIAAGGMGEVYEAHDRLLDETVALKTLALPVLDDDGAAFRFKAEARLARRVSHPNVCRISEFGMHVRPSLGGLAERIPFLTMEFLVGHTLRSHIERSGALPLEKALDLLQQIVFGVEAIHRAGIVHRDLKSENVFLVPRADGSLRAVLMDFGLARSLDGTVVSSWQAGSLVGTIDCMAPEQISGEPVTTRADVFALGVLMFEMVSGRRPFLNVPPLKRMREAAPRLLAQRPDISAAWDRAVARCLELSPAARFSDVQEVLTALSRSPGDTADQPRGLDRRALWLAVGVVLGLAAATSLVQIGITP